MGFHRFQPKYRQTFNSGQLRRLRFVPRHASGDHLLVPRVCSASAVEIATCKRMEEGVTIGLYFYPGQEVWDFPKEYGSGIGADSAPKSLHGLESVLLSAKEGLNQSILVATTYASAQRVEVQVCKGRSATDSG